VHISNILEKLVNIFPADWRTAEPDTSDYAHGLKSTSAVTIFVLYPCMKGDV